MAQTSHSFSWAIHSMYSFGEMYHQDGITIRNSFIHLEEDTEEKTVNLRRSKSASSLPRENEMAQHSGQVNKRKRRIPMNKNTIAVMMDVPEGMDASAIQGLLDQVDVELNGGRRSYSCIYCPFKNGKVVGYCEVNFLDHDGAMRAVQTLSFKRFDGCNKTIRFSQKTRNDGTILQGKDFIDRYLWATQLMCEGPRGGLLFFGEEYVRALKAGYGKALQTAHWQKRAPRWKHGSFQPKKISSQKVKPRDQKGAWGGANADSHHGWKPWDTQNRSVRGPHRHWPSENASTCTLEKQDVSWEEDMAKGWCCGEDEMYRSRAHLELTNFDVKDWWSCSVESFPLYG